MTTEPTGVRIRTYNVGFGDCFLVTFVYESEPDRHVLIDFGTMGLPRARGADAPIHSTHDVALGIAETCREGQLAAVVATHRHQDHISGFAGASGEVIASLQPSLVVQPWTEDPMLPENASEPERASVATSFGLANDSLRGILTELGLLASTGSDIDVESLVRSSEAHRTTRRSIAIDDLTDIAFTGNNNIKNEAAIAGLTAMASQREYLHAGMQTTLSDHLPGVTVSVLGPPTLEQAPSARRQRPSHATEFWHLVAEVNQDVAGLMEVGGARPDDTRATTEARFPREANSPIEARWLQRRLDWFDSRELLSIVRDFDNALNNTSLILLFEIWTGYRTRRMLFPGDAQIENWQHCLGDERLAERLSAVDVYKVGHHGSLNATPKESLWERFDRRDATGDEQLVTMLSTSDGRHGHLEDGTEVPRKVLVDELQARSRLVDTRTLADAREQMFADVNVRPDGVEIPGDRDRSRRRE